MRTEAVCCAYTPDRNGDARGLPTGVNNHTGALPDPSCLFRMGHSPDQEATEVYSKGSSHHISCFYYHVNRNLSLSLCSLFLSRYKQFLSPLPSQPPSLLRETNSPQRLLRALQQWLSVIVTCWDRE